MALGKDVFGRRALEFGGAFAADSACIGLVLDCLDADDNLFQIDGLLTQQFSVQYQQPITRLYEVGTQKTYYIAGRPQGTANVARILGPGEIMAEFYECLGDVCNADMNDLCFCVEAGCGEDEDIITDEFKALNFCLKNVVMQSIGLSVAAQDMIINEQLSLFFTSLLVEDAYGCQCQAVDVTCATCF